MATTPMACLTRGRRGALRKLEDDISDDPVTSTTDGHVRFSRDHSLLSHSRAESSSFNYFAAFVIRLNASARFLTLDVSDLSS